MTAKSALAAVLMPAAKAAGRAAHFKRLWAHARLSAQITGAVDTSVVVLGTPEVHGTGRIYLGRNLYLYRDLYFETQEHGEIRLGSNIVISRGAHLVSFASIEIGDGTMIGEYSSIRDANHQFGSARDIRSSGHSGSSIRIGRNVWIGRGVAVLAGVAIGDNAVIGANAVVTRDVAADSVVAGVPARELPRKVTV